MPPAASTGPSVPTCPPRRIAYIDKRRYIDGRRYERRDRAETVRKDEDAGGDVVRSLWADLRRRLPARGAPAAGARPGRAARALGERARRPGRLLRAAGGAGALGRRGGRARGGVQGARRPGPCAHPEPDRDRPRPGVRLRADRPARAVPADGVTPPQEADRRRPARSRAARQMGVLLTEARGRRHAGGGRGYERSVVLMATSA